MIKARAVVVLDVGKTHVRVFAIEPHGGQVVESYQTSNRSLDEAPYFHVDVERIWAWLIGALSDLGKKVEILAIVPCAYGSTAALIDEDGLVLPMMDYEAEPPADIVSAYASLAPDFAEVCCPVSPGALTLGRQLFWQSQHHPKAFARMRWILMAAQYWAWRLTGKVAIEPTSLGAQTQLWNPRTGAFTGLARNRGWCERFPALAKPFDEVGPLRPDLTKDLGLQTNPPVLVGIHDSNANYARYLAAGFRRFTLISSGTWLITFDTNLVLDRLDPTRDMVANTDLEGRPVACTRFMGGREFFEIAGAAGLKVEPGLHDLEGILKEKTMAIPSFSNSGGPFPGSGHQGRIEGPAPETVEKKSALAALYVALVTDVDLDLLDSDGDVIVDGSFAENDLFCGLLAALRSGQRVMVSKEPNGTALGASLLFGWQSRTEPVSLNLDAVASFDLEKLASYKALWRSRLGLE
ncbi:MAG: FGGY-family carbohydrate kinase [Geminicoccales bacterium]